MSLKQITTDIATLKQVYKIAKQKHLKTVNFEFIVGSCFPNILKNIKEEMQLQHAQGYVEGLKDGKAEV